jgi:ubiquinone/menaquinone biosynthesis C-methylase UbiE
MIPNETSERKRIKDYWEESTPMSFLDKNLSYEEKRRFRYSLQDYMHEVFRFSDFRDKLVLDLGCGAGIDSAEFARNGATVISVDITENATTLTKNLMLEAGLPYCVIQADALYLPFRSSVFDCVYCFGVLHHIPEIEKALAEIRRVLKTGGQVMAMLYNRDSLLYAYSIVYLRGIKEGLLGKFTLDEILSKYSERRYGNPYTRAYTKIEAKELFEKFFKDVHIEVRYNVIDLPDERKVKVGLPDKYELGWHLIIKAIKK